MILEILKKRFHDNMERHPNLDWQKIEAILSVNPEQLAILEKMEESGGEPDTIGYDAEGKLIYCDCAAETPSGHRGFCYDEEALLKRKKNPPAGSAVKQAEQMGVSLMDEELYYRLQETGKYDLKTSSWIATPASVRKLGGALFCERRYEKVFTFHNGADSYYSVRGWRGFITIG